MKRIAAFLIATIGISPMLRAQCPHNPTVTPTNVILCPGATDTLRTQVYDAYQWYRDGQLLAGDTLQYRAVSTADAGSQFTVRARLNGCDELSPPVLVDGWMFLLPVVQTVGLRDTLCLGRDTLILVLMQPYTTSIQWTRNGQPIPGANDDTLLVTTTGDYCVSGAPEICPNFLQTLGVIMSYTFVNCGSGVGIGNDEDNIQQTLVLYPNPARDVVHLEIKSTIDEPLTWRIKDLAGRTIENGLVTSQNLKINIEHISPGHYVMEFRGSNQFFIKRWVKVQ